ncbi:MAG: hypothetical protein ACRDDW_03195 [Candidatus Rhabdochlamydia sp.]
MVAITTTLHRTGPWSPVEVTLKNTYTNQVDLNGAVISFLNPYGLNGAPWGIEGIESTGGSLSATTTSVGDLQKTQITLRWASARTLNPNQSVKLAFTLSGEVKVAEFTELRTDLVEDPTAKLFLFLKAPKAPEGTTTEQAKVFIVSPFEVTRDTLVPFGQTKKINHLFEGSYVIKPQPVKIGDATYYPEQDTIDFELTNTTSGETITWDYKEPEYSVPVVFKVPPISIYTKEDNITTVMHLNEQAALLKFGSDYTTNLIADRTYFLVFSVKAVNNKGYLLYYSSKNSYTPKKGQANIVQLQLKEIAINTSTFISTKILVTGAPMNAGKKRITLTGPEQFMYIYDLPLLANTLVGLVKPGSYKIDAQDFIFNGIRYKFVEQHPITISNNSHQVEVSFKEGFDLKVPGWPKHLAHGGITFNSEAELHQYEKIAVECIFKYAGINGGGDRGVILDPNTIPTHTTISHARLIEESQNHARSVMPAMVFYTAELSGGVNDDDLRDDENLRIHYINLINELIVAMSYKENQHPIPCTYIMNPDFLGMIQQNRDISPVIQGLFEPNSIHVNAQLAAAIAYVLSNTQNLVQKQKKKLSNTAPSFANDIFGYIQSINWVMREFGPDVVFGWQFNVWQNATAYWAYENPDQTITIANSIADFIDEMQAYKGKYAPDFIVFDKYERDDFGPDAIGAYAWGARSWKRYLKFVDIISDRIKSPAMLWQIPGCHMPNKQEGSSLVTNGHAGSGGSFFMGDITIGSNLNNIDPSLLNLAVSNPYYYANTVGGILAQDNFYDWSKQELKEATHSNTFAILWGGGRTTGLVTGIEPGTDPAWLTTRVDAYYNSPIELI